MSKKLLDLFCCCGGISKGFHNQGFECVGVDIKDNHNYPYEFIHKDIFQLPLSFFERFDLIHASPPCQQFSWSAKQWINKGYEFEPDMVDRTRQLLIKVGKPFIIENVVGAPIRNDLRLCGEMFGLRVLRHRIFELNGFDTTVLQPSHIKHRSPIDYNHSYYVNLTGHGGQSYSFKIEDWQKAIGIDWVTDKKHLTQMIPPKYSEYIAKFF